MKNKLLLVGLLLLFLGTFSFIAYKYCIFGSCHLGQGTQVVEVVEKKKIVPPKDFTIAFLADQGVTDDSRKVLQLVKSEGASMVIHPGDFDYLDDPEAWDTMIIEELDKNFPYFITVGNHDLKRWDEYQEKFAERLEFIDEAKCEGDLGVKSVCTYKGLRFVLSGVGTMGFDHNDYIRETLASSDEYLWEICAWHKNMQKMQVGGKKDETGWGVYDACREGGAFIATGHEHSYSRTHLMSDFENQEIASTSDILEISKGKVFAFVSGIAGHSIRDQKDELAENPWWASVYTNQQDADHGALFCTFSPDGEENKAKCYFKDISGNVVDEFVIINKA